MKRLLTGGAVAVAVAAIVGTVTAAGGPPQFLTFPILLHVGEDGLDHGHFVFSEEVAVPGPLAKDLGSADYAPAATGVTLLTSPGVSDADVSGSPGSYEGETGAAFSGSVLVGGSNHIFPGACSASAAPGTAGDCAPLAYISSDGTSWVRRSMSRVVNGTTFGIAFDPAIDYDKAGNFYYSYGVAPLGGSYPNGIAVSKSSADGLSWASPVAVTFNRNRAFDDKYYIAIDRSNTTFANRIYVSWDRNQGNNQILYISSSSNSGASWSTPVKVNDGKTSFERVIGAYPAVDHTSGVVYDSWHDYAKNVIYVDKSTTGGATWGTDRAAATTHAGFGQDIGCVGGRAQGPAHALKVGPSGKLYLVYADPVKNRGFDILLTTSANGGTTWTAPKTLNDDTTSGDQFHPTLSVESNGSGGDKVTVTFYDRRDDGSNCAAHVYATQSVDSGTSWSVNIRETTAPSNFDGNPNGPGDYSSSSPAFGSVYPFFSDHRSTDYEIYTADVH